MRTFNSARNAAVGVLYLGIKTVLDFVLRTVFIHTLSSSYLGVNGLFSNILMILNLAELGVGNAIIYNLYKPVAQNDISKIRSLMLLYKKCYHIIGIFIFVAGLCIMPFLNSFITYDAETIKHIEIIYFLYLINTASSYFMVYKTTLITVHEKVYITNIIRMVMEVIMVLLQVITLLLFKNFYLYLVILIGNTILVNFINSVYAKKLYPEELELKGAKPIQSNERKSIFKDVYALMMYKIGGVVSNATDNIIISSFIGLSTVGLYSNYSLIVNAMNKILTNIFNGIVASLGNLNVSSDKERSLSIYYQINFFTFYLYGAFSVVFFCIVQNFIVFWIGEEFLLSTATLIAITLNFYIYGVNNVSIMYRNTLGLFIIGKYRPLIGAAINIVLSIILAQKVGISGVLFATAISNLLTTLWFDPRMILKHGFNKKPWLYYFKQITYILVIILTVVISCYINRFINMVPVISLIVKAVVSGAVFTVISILAFWRTKDFKNLINTILSLKTILKRR